MKEGAKITQQKGRRIPIQLQNQVDDEIEKLLNEGHFEKVDKIQDDVFIQTTVITVKKDKTVKIASDARAINESIAKNKYQMPNLENLIDMVAEKLDKKEGLEFVSRYDVRLRTNSFTRFNKETLHFPNIREEINRNLSLYNGILWSYCNAHRFSKMNGSHICQYK